MPHKFYYPPKVWHPTYMEPYYFYTLGRIPTRDNWLVLSRADRYNFLLPDRLSKIGPPPKISELRILEEQPLKYRPIHRVWDLWVMKRIDIYNFFKDDLTSKFLESPKPPLEIIIPSRKRKISDLDKIEY
jgi:hypothetical protein